MPADLMGGRVVFLPTMTLSKEITAFFLQCKTKTKCLLARVRHADRHRECLFIGVDRKSLADGQNDEIGPIADMRRFCQHNRGQDRHCAEAVGGLGKQRRTWVCLCTRCDECCFETLRRSTSAQYYHATIARRKAKEVGPEGASFTSSEARQPRRQSCRLWAPPLPKLCDCEVLSLTCLCDHRVHAKALMSHARIDLVGNVVAGSLQLVGDYVAVRSERIDARADDRDRRQVLQICCNQVQARILFIAIAVQQLVEKPRHHGRIERFCGGIFFF